MKPVRGRITTLTLSILLLFVTGASLALASYELHDPFVADPLGPYSMLNNPAGIYDESRFAVRAAIGQGMFGSDTTQLVAYIEPDMGHGAGALYWHGADLAAGGKIREIGYVVARRATNNLVYGIALKHVREDEMGVWAGDLGLMTTGPGPLQAGVTVHNLFGQSVITPTKVTAGVNYQMAPTVGLAASLGTPRLGEWKDLEAGVAVDVQALSGTKVRLGRVVNVDSMEGYWFGGVKIDLNSFQIDANVAVAGADRRIMLGAVYRF